MRALVVVALVLLATADVHGHGRPPMTNGMLFDETDRAALVVPSTIGLLISRDNGCTFQWVCEESIGYGDPFDPKYAVARDGSIFATTFMGLRISRDSGCSFTTATATLPAGDPNRIADIWIDALDLGPTGEVWVGTAGGVGTPNDIYASTDNGTTFTPRGLPTTTLAYNSIRVAPGDPTRVYATGARSPEIGLFRRDSTGMWQQLALTGVQLGTPPWVTVAAVDRTNPDTFYIVSQGASGGGGGDRLYRSTDGGMTFVEVFATERGLIKDVVVRDAQIVYVTTLVLSGSIFIGGPAHASSDGGATFAPIDGAPQLSCVGIASDGSVFGCGSNWMPDFMAVAKLEGTTWNKVWRFVELAGSIECPAGTAGHDACEPLWDMVQITLGTTGPACGVHEPDGPPPTDDPGCWCGAGGHPASLAWALAVMWLVVRRRSSPPA